MGNKNEGDKPRKWLCHFNNRQDPQDENSAEGEQGFTVSQAMSVSLVADKLLEYLPTSDLLNSSLVCKMWRNSTRESLRRRMECLLRINFEGDSYDNLSDLTTLLKKSTVVPYCGISITCASKQSSMRGRWRTTLARQRCWKSFELIVAEKIEKFKVFHLNYSLGVDEDVIAGAESLCLRIWNQLQVLKLEGDPPPASKLFNSQSSAWQLPNLREFQFPSPSNCSNCIIQDIVYEVVMSAPSLRTLDGYVDPSWTNHRVFEILSNRRLLTNFTFKFEADLLSKCQEVAASEPELKKLSLKYNYDLDARQMTLQFRIGRNIIRNSSQTLEELMISSLRDLTYSSPLPVCPKLSSLNFLFPLSLSNLRMMSGVFRNINMAASFPNLKKVLIRVTEDQSYESYEHCRNTVDDILRNEPIHQILSVLDLELKNVSTYSASHHIEIETNQIASLLHLCSNFFPNVKTFGIRNHTGDGVATALKVLRMDWMWPNLTSVGLLGIDLSRLSCSFDDVICGIPLKEAESLRRFDGDLRVLNIVPSKRSILDRKRLEVISFEVRHDKLCEKNPGKLVLSEVAGACGFGRRREPLSVRLFRVGANSLEPQNRFDLSHLSSYVDIITKNYGL